MTIDERVDSICRWGNQGLRALVREALLEAMRDQRHACAEALTEIEPAGKDSNGSTTIGWHAAHQAVMNANVK